MGIYIVASAALIIGYLLASWLGASLRLSGATLWLLRASLSIIISLGAASLFWLYRKLKRDDLVAGVPEGIIDEIDSLIETANGRLRAISPAHSLQTLPLVFILGEPGSAKTSVMLHSGLAPELIAGQAKHGQDVLPTTTLNIWLAGQTVFMELSGNLLQFPGALAVVLDAVTPDPVQTSLRRSALPARGAIVCFDCDKLNAGAEPTSVSAKSLAQRLAHIGAKLGADFPVYVLFTRLDRVSHFTEYASQLTPEEAGEVLGATLPRQTFDSAGTPLDLATAATRAFDQIIFSLAEKRLDYLSRETTPQTLPAIYEFPRQLQKLRSLIAQSLTDLVSAAEAEAKPFVRGYYFSGVRPTFISELVAAPPPQVSGGGNPAATRIFSLSDVPSAAPAGAAARQTRKVPEWTFLPTFFSEVLLADRNAFLASTDSSHLYLVRRALLSSATALFLFLALGTAVSFFQNRALEQRVLVPAKSLAAGMAAVTDQPTPDQLQQLDSLRQALLELERNEAQGAPSTYRFGLYSGSKLYADARQHYFHCFRLLLLAPVETRLLNTLRNPPATKSSEDFQQVYGSLKAYLVTTSDRDKAGWEGFVPALLERSAFYQSSDPATQDLVRSQFVFYAAELQQDNPYASEVAESEVARARVYLRQFDGAEAIYHAMLEGAAKGKSPVTFASVFPAAAQAINAPYEVPAAFTKPAFVVMQQSLQHPERFTSEDWVLGNSGPSTALSADKLGEQLTARYYDEYAGKWRAFLRAAHVGAFGGLNDASAKLARLSGNDSPLLALLYVVEDNTAVDAPPIKEAFESVQSLCNGCTRQKLVSSGNQGYMTALVVVQSMLAAIAKDGDRALLPAATQAVASAHASVNQLAQGFRIDNQGRIDAVLTQLLQEPVSHAEVTLRRWAETTPPATASHGQ